MSDDIIACVDNGSFSQELLVSRIQSAMDERGWKKEELARRSKVNKGLLSDLLGGNRKQTSLAVVVRIAEALGVHLDWLVCRRGDMFIDPRSAPAARPKTPLTSLTSRLPEQVRIWNLESGHPRLSLRQRDIAQKLASEDMTDEDLRALFAKVIADHPPPNEARRRIAKSHAPKKKPEPQPPAVAAVVQPPSRKTAG